MRFDVSAFLKRHESERLMKSPVFLNFLLTKLGKYGILIRVKL